MKLQEALLCVDCESLFPVSRACPQCGSQVSYPLSRALNRAGPSAAVLAGRAPHGAQVHPRPVEGAASRASPLFQSV
jgi:predicted amidophosphoribosyltransferase